MWHVWLVQTCFNYDWNSELLVPIGSEVQLTLWDNAGRQVADIFKGYLKAGSHAQSFIAQDIPSGVYFVRLEASGGVITRKFALMK